MCNQLPKQIQKTLAILRNAQTSNAFVETARPLVAVDLMLFRFLNVRIAKPFQVFHQTRLDLLVVQELGECVEFLMQKLICEIDLRIPGERNGRIEFLNNHKDVQFVPWCL